MNGGPEEASMLRGQIRVVLDDYRRKCADWTDAGKADEETVGKADQAAAGAAKDEAKEFQARHAALKAALGHLELLIKLARLVEGGGKPEEDSEEELLAEAERNLARPA